MEVKDLYFEAISYLDNESFYPDSIHFLYNSNGELGYEFFYKAGSYYSLSDKYKYKVDKILSNPHHFDYLIASITLKKLNNICSISFYCLDEQYNIDSKYSNFLFNIFKEKGACCYSTEFGLGDSFYEPIFDENELISIGKEEIKRQLNYIRLNNERESKSISKKIKKFLFGK